LNNFCINYQAAKKFDLLFKIQGQNKKVSKHVALDKENKVLAPAGRCRTFNELSNTYDVTFQKGFLII
jgi:hypothetical protein